MFGIVFLLGFMSLIIYYNFVWNNKSVTKETRNCVCHFVFLKLQFGRGLYGGES